MPIIGTAGHVDHGKSTLVEALTGRNPDRWAEEKERGLTIDLGFAWAQMDNRSVGFVDVPGHERFLKNMLAGIGAINVALFVVAADEGWMPQSEEHLAILDLLAVRNGVIAITRADIVDNDILELVELEVTDRVAGSSLEGWPIVMTAAPKGIGVNAVRTALAAALIRAGTSVDRERPRMWIDRAFTISGAGTVVTGTLVDGAVTRGDELFLWPPGSSVRVRGIQSHETDENTVLPGNRAAINLAGAERAQIARGAMLGRASDFRTTTTFLADLRTVRTLTKSLTDRGAYHLHVGSGNWPVQLRMIEETSDRHLAVVFRAPIPLPLTAGDRLILRDVGRRSVVAGGVVLDPHPRTVRKGEITHRLPRLRSVIDGPVAQRAETFLEDRRIARIADLVRDAGGGLPVSTLTTGGLAVSQAAAAEHIAVIEQAVSSYQRENPFRVGAPKSSIASLTSLDVAVVELIIQTTPDLVDDGATIRTVEFLPAWGDTQEQSWQLAKQQLLGNGLAVPRASQLGLEDEVLHSLLRDRRLVRIADDLAYLPSQLEELQQRLGTLKDGFTVADFRDSMGITRRHAVPLLEWLDSQGWTSRRGDTRKIRRQPSPRPGGALPQ